jgi:hypothetical protein
MLLGMKFKISVMIVTGGFAGIIWALILAFEFFEKKE